MARCAARSAAVLPHQPGQLNVAIFLALWVQEYIECNVQIDLNSKPQARPPSATCDGRLGKKHCKPSSQKTPYLCEARHTPSPQTKSKPQEQSQPPLIKDLGNNCSSKSCMSGAHSKRIVEGMGGTRCQPTGTNKRPSPLCISITNSLVAPTPYSWSTPTTTTTTTAATTTTTATTPTSSSTTTTANTTTTTTTPAAATTTTTIPFPSQPVAQLGVRYVAVHCTGASRALGQVPLRIAASLRPTHRSRDRAAGHGITQHWSAKLEIHRMRAGKQRTNTQLATISSAMCYGLRQRLNYVQQKCCMYKWP